MTEHDSWETYSFPKLEFQPIHLPYAGLCEALWERRNVYEQTADLPDTGEATEPENPYRPDLFSICGKGRDAAVSFDHALREVAGHYVNHLTADFETLTEIPLWTLESLCDALEESFLDPSKEEMLPEWPVEWALQRFRMIRLLRFTRIDYQCSCLIGSEHSGEPMSPEAAIEAAMSGIAPGDPVRNARIARTTTTIWGPDHGWKEGSYCADVYQSGNLSAIVPEELREAEIRLYLSLDSPDGDPDSFDSYGTGLIRGLNVLTADSSGNFSNDWPLPAMPDRTRVPVRGTTETFGFHAVRTFCCADFSSTFHFTNKDGE